MPKDYNETEIRLDHDERIMEIWTTNRAVVSLLKRVGATPLERQIQGQWWKVGVRVGRRGFILGKPRRQGYSRVTRATPEQLDAPGSIEPPDPATVKG